MSPSLSLTSFSSLSPLSFHLSLPPSLALSLFNPLSLVPSFLHSLHEMNRDHLRELHAHSFKLIRSSSSYLLMYDSQNPPRTVSIHVVSLQNLKTTHTPLWFSMRCEVLVLPPSPQISPVLYDSMVGMVTHCVAELHTNFRTSFPVDNTVVP